MITLFVGGGVLLFIFKDGVLEILNNNAEILTPEMIIQKASTANKETLDNAILGDARFLTLKENVKRFDFDSICKNSVGELSLVSTSSDGTVSTTTQKINCALGNGAPFPLPTVKKD